MSKISEVSRRRPGNLYIDSIRPRRRHGRVRRVPKCQKIKKNKDFLIPKPEKTLFFQKIKFFKILIFENFILRNFGINLSINPSIIILITIIVNT